MVHFCFDKHAAWNQLTWGQSGFLDLDNPHHSHHNHCQSICCRQEASAATNPREPCDASHKRGRFCKLHSCLPSRKNLCHYKNAGGWWKHLKTSPDMWRLEGDFDWNLQPKLISRVSPSKVFSVEGGTSFKSCAFFAAVLYCSIQSIQVIQAKTSKMMMHRPVFSKNINANALGESGLCFSFCSTQITTLTAPRAHQRG